MTWTVTNLLIEIIAGIAGAHFVAVAANDYSFGSLGHCGVGAMGGGFVGYFIPSIAAAIVTTNVSSTSQDCLNRSWRTASPEPSRAAS